MPVTDLLVEEPPQIDATKAGGSRAGSSASAVDEVPTAGKRVLCKHPFDDVKRAFVTPSKVVPVHSLVYGPPEGGGKSKLLIKFPTIDAVRDRCAKPSCSRMQFAHGCCCAQAMIVESPAVSLNGCCVTAVCTELWRSPKLLNLQSDDRTRSNAPRPPAHSKPNTVQNQCHESATFAPALALAGACAHY
jgi:hypothetical protein